MASYERALALNPQAGWSALQYAHCAALARDFRRPRAGRSGPSCSSRSGCPVAPGALIVGAFVRLGQAKALQGLHAEAVAEYEKELEFLRDVDHALRSRIFIELHQRRGESRLALGETEAGRLDLDLGLEAFERRLRNGADDPMTRYYAACCLRPARRDRAGPPEPGEGGGAAASADRGPRSHRACARVLARPSAIRGPARPGTRSRVRPLGR